MINLMSPERKRDMAAARINTHLLHYSFAFALLAVVIGLIYGLGFWLMWQDEQIVKEKLTTQTVQAQAYTKVEQEANAFRQNLVIAKRILASEKTYSSFLTTVAQDMPSGAILTNFSIGSAPTTPAAKGTNTMQLEARANSYGKVLELKNKLEQSELFENVSIVNTTRPDNLGTLSGLEARYPYQATLSVKLSVVPQAGATR